MKHQFFVRFSLFLCIDFSLASSMAANLGGGDIPIEPSSFDLIVIGTGLPESLVAR